MIVWLMTGILGICILVVAFCALIILPSLNQSIFSAANAADQGWPPLFQFVMNGWWYIVIGLILGAVFLVIRRAKGGGPV